MAHIHFCSSLAALCPTDALSQRAAQGGMAQVAGVGASRAPAFWAEFQDAAPDKGAVRLALGQAHVDLGTRHGGPVLSPGQSGVVRTETLSQTHHTELRARGRRLRGGKEEQRWRRCMKI